MKKIIALLLSLMMICGLFACSGETANKDNEQPDAQTEQTEQEEQTEQSEEAEQTEATVYSESLPLGGNAGVYTLKGSAYGKYTEIEAPTELIFDETDEIHVYFDESCDTPYIAVYRWAKDGNSLEDVAKTISDTCNGGYYEIVNNADWGIIDSDTIAYFCDSFELNGQYYFCDNMIFEDGDDFVEVDCYGKSVEVQIADTNTYMWVPAGYTDILTDDAKAHGAFIYGEYDESHYFPSLWGCKAEFTYEYFTWLWSIDYPDGLPFTEEQLAEFPAETDWTYEDNEKFYALFGEKLLQSDKYTYNGIESELNILTDSEETFYEANVLFELDGTVYELWLYTEQMTGTPYIGESLLKSIHTKGDTEATVYADGIPLGGNLPAYSLEGKALGEYKEISDTDIFSFDDSVELHVYEDKNSDTPYIAVYRWNKDGKTFEENVQAEADEFNGGYVDIFESNELTGGKMGFYCTCSDIEDGEFAGFYYINICIFEDGDDIVEIDFYAASEELQLGDTNTYLWVPKGSESIMTDDAAAHGTLFWGTYDDSYYLPTIWIAKMSTAYEDVKWTWSAEDWYEEFPLSEEEYNALPTTAWTEEEEERYYGVFGAEIVYRYNTENAELLSLSFEGKDGAYSDIYINLTDNVEDTYEIWTEYPTAEGAPYIGHSIIESVHTK